MQKKRQPRGKKTFPVNLEGHRINLTSDQVIGAKDSWQNCHGQASDGTKVNSLKIKRIGDTVFIRDDNRRQLAGFKWHELEVALPEIQSLINGDASSATDVN